MKILNPNDKIIGLFFLTAPLSVCTIVFNNVGVLLYFIVAFAALICLINKKLILDRRIITLCILFFLPIILSYACSYINFVTFANSQYENYFFADMPVRLVNCLIFFIIFIFGYTSILDNSVDRLLLKLRWYFYGVFIFLGIFGIWQILNILLGVWIPEIGTRVNIHSIIGGNSLIGLFRVTSLANEPSYLVPFLLDAILLSLYFRKKFFALILIVILLFSLSLGGYANGIILLCCATYLFRSKILLKKHFLLFIVISPLLIFIFWEEFVFLLNIILSRKELSGDFSIGDSSRTEMVTMPWKFLFEGSFISILFGNGPGSFKFLSLTKQLTNGDFFHSTSNCLYTDMAYEGGLVAVIGIFIFFIYFWYLFSKINNDENFRETTFGKLMLMQLFISSFYRADFVSPRFWSVVILVYIFYKLSEYKKNGYHISNCTNV